jgi:alpha-beta hydrolase superfamily lysophospholipase
VLHLDLTRTDSDGSQRQFAVTVRYPAAASVAGEVNNAPAAAGTFSLVVFAPGYDTSADTYAAIERDLASAGFVVATPDFPHTSSASSDGLDESDVANQPADLSSTIDTLTTAAPALIAGHVSAGKAGVVGHSDGGVTAAGLAYNSCCADHRIGAAVILSGAESDFAGSWFPAGSPPLLAIHGTADEVNPFSSSQQLFDDASGSKDLVSVANGSHLGPFTTDSVRPAVSTLVADFLRAHLSRDAAAAARVVPDANVSGLQLVASG